ncbi:MAG: hypothetical protein A4E65_01567 [Syntrophorhabdus sp. PtaU1.Bin153]|nr:MAG: hypothetical protein A4E65_01567 [Syntrophorhabdus sp. PtaU1.Bin153]
MKTFNPMKRIKERPPFHPLVILAFAGMIALAMVLPSMAEETSVDLQQEIASAVAPDQTKRLDPFSIAIVVISLGGMLAASSIQYLHSRKTSLENEMASLTTYGSTTNAITLTLAVQGDEEPRKRELQRLMQSMQQSLDSLERRRTVMIESIARSEDKAMRWIR